MRTAEHRRKTEHGFATWWKAPRVTLALFLATVCAVWTARTRTAEAQPGRYDHRRRPPYRPYDRDRRKNRPGTTGADDRTRKTSGEPATKALLAGEHEFNQCRRFPSGKRLKVTLKPDSELHDLVAWISGMTCKRFIVGSNIHAQKVTIYSPTPIRASEAYRAFISALNVMGLTVQPAGRYLKIVEIRRAKGVQTLCPPGRGCPGGDRLVTRLIRLKHVNPDEIKGVLDGLKSPDGNILTYAPTSLVIITDLGQVAADLQRIIGFLDVEAKGERIWVVRLKHSEASVMAQMLSEIFDTASKGRQQPTRSPIRPYRPRTPRTAKNVATAAVTTGGSAGVQVSKIIPDDRTNLLIIVADERSYLRVRALIWKLDIPVKGGKERIHVVGLANANAEEMRDTLSGLVAGGAGGYRGRTTQRTTGRGRTPQSRGRQGARPGAVGLFEGEVQITADKATNSLVIIASAKDFMSLKKVINQLDIPRRQVFVEATILEVSLSKTRDLGLAFHGGKTVGSGDKQSLLLFGNNASKSIALDPTSLMGLAVGLRGPELENAESLLGIPGISFPTFGAFFMALQSNNDVNVLSQPHILTTDNEEAIIEVGENVPFQAGVSGIPGLTGGAGTTGTTGLGYYPMVSIQRQDVTLKLKITPHVNESNFVRLEIEQEINEVKSIDTTVGPTTTKKKIKTVIVLKDQQTAVMGGLITEKTKRNVTKIPLLGDIPILGYLFKTTKTIKEKSNLLIFITPYIIRDQSDLQRIFQRKLQQRKEFLERYTAFKDYDLDAVIDYRYKRGLLQEINRVASGAEEEERLKQQAILESKEPDVDGPVVTNPRDQKEIRDAYRKARKDAQKVKEEEEKKGEKERKENKGADKTSGEPETRPAEASPVTVTVVRRNTKRTTRTRRRTR